MFGRPRFSEKMSPENGIYGELRDNITEGNASGLKKIISAVQRDDFNTELSAPLLKRIKRDLRFNPCYKKNSFKNIKLVNGKKTWRVKCKTSTNTGCFNNILPYTTTLCQEIKVFFPSVGTTVVQDCSCA